MQRRRKVKAGQIIRVEDLQRRLEEEGIDDVDPEAVVSAYIPRRKGKLFGAALLRMDRLRIFLISGAIVLTAIFIIAIGQEKTGNFTVNLNRLEMFDKGISISADANFTEPTARLLAESLDEVYDTTLDWLPENLDDVDGSHNGQDYMAFTYYVRNAGKETVGYDATVTLNSQSKGAEKAVRVAIWENGDRIIYAAPAADGGEEEGCVSFSGDKVVCSYRCENFEVGFVNKYTVVIWMEGEDPECVDSIVGGGVEFEMDINAISEDETTTWQKLVQDIRDTISGDKPISAGGVDAPDYNAWGEGLTWETRRNQT